MSDDLNTEIKIGADASGVEAGVGRAKRSLASLGDSAKKAGQDAGAGMDAVGAGGERSAKKIERDTKIMQGSLQRYLATLEAGSKDSRRYWENMADFKGVDRNALRPLLNQLDAYKAQNDAQQAALTNLKKRQVQLQQELRSANAGKGMDEEAKQVEAERLKREIERLASDTAALSAL